MTPDDDTIQRVWVFEVTVHEGYTGTKNTWEYKGTQKEAREEFRGYLDRNWSPFVTYAFWDKETGKMP